MDQKLGRYYRNALSRFVWLIALFGAGVNMAISYASDQFGATSFAAKALGSLLTFGFIAALYLFGERLIRTRLWRLAYPEFDLSGTWTGSTTYARRYDNVAPPASIDFEQFTKPNVVLLEQDCLGISVQATPAPTGTGTWYSLASSFHLSATGPSVRYAYRVSYGGEPGFPDEADGYEELHVQAPLPGKRPDMLRGTFAHCARGQTPWYSGSVAFARADAALPATVSGWSQAIAFLEKLLAGLGKPGVE